MELTILYGRYLQNRLDQTVHEPLVVALRTAGYTLEADVLARYFAQGSRSQWITQDAGVWAERRIWVGEDLPSDPQSGDFWFDTAEVMLMLLVPRDPADLAELNATMIQQITPFEGWLSLRPVAEWQYAAFLSQVEIADHPVQIAPPFKLLDPQRSLRNRERKPVTSVTPDEALLYVIWCGKGLPYLSTWARASAELSAEQFAALWGDSRREWVSDQSNSDEGSRVIATPDNLFADPDDDDAATGSATQPKLLYGEWYHAPDVAFRSAVSTQLGLVTLDQAGFAASNLALRSQLVRRTLSAESRAARDRMLAEEAEHGPVSPADQHPITNPKKFGFAPGFDDQADSFADQMGETPSPDLLLTLIETGMAALQANPTAMRQVALQRLTEAQAALRKPGVAASNPATAAEQVRVLEQTLAAHGFALQLDELTESVQRFFATADQAQLRDVIASLQGATKTPGTISPQIPEALVNLAQQVLQKDEATKQAQRQQDYAQSARDAIARSFRARGLPSFSGGDLGNQDGDQPKQ